MGGERWAGREEEGVGESRNLVAASVMLDASGRAIIVAEAGHSAGELLPC